MIETIIILAGGISSRMKKNSKEEVQIDSKLLDEANRKSKSLIGLGNKGRPFVDYLLFNIAEAGFKNVIIIINNREKEFEHYYSNGKGFAEILNISFAYQKIPENRTKPMGTADALLQALEQNDDLINKSFAVCNSDNLYSVNALKLIRENGNANCMIEYLKSGFEFHDDRIDKFAVIEKDKHNNLTAIWEKPDITVLSRLQELYGDVGVSMNLFSFSYKNIFIYLENVKPNVLRNEKELPQAVLNMLEEHAMHVITLSEHVPDLTSKKDIVHVQEWINKSKEFGWLIK